MTILELREKRAKAWEATKAFLDSHRNDKGVLSAEDDAAYTRMEQEITDLGKEIARLERQEALEAELNRPVNKPLTGKPMSGKEDAKTGRATDEYRQNFWNMMRSKTPMPTVMNALQIGTDSEGGYLVPDEYERTLVEALEEENIFRQLAKIIQTSSVTENGLAVTLSDGDTVKIVDNSKTFADVPASHWASGSVAFATSRELFTGTSAATFSPDAATTRAMIVTVLARLEDVDTTDGSTWYEAGQQWAMENGISDGTNMEGYLTREQLAAMLYRYAGSPAVSGRLSDYPDAEQVSDWARDAMLWATENGIINGIGGKLSPASGATRAQLATMLMRFAARLS